MPSLRLSWAAIPVVAGGLLFSTHGCGGSAATLDAELDGSTLDDGATASVDGHAGVDGHVGTSSGTSDSSVTAARDASVTGVADTGVTGTKDTGAAGSDGAASSGVSVLQHHNHATRDGVYVDPAMTPAAFTTFHLDTTFKGTVTGNVYAQPLYVAQGPGNAEAFYVATESNHLTALGASGWDKTFGTSKTGALANKPCGTVDPLGITGTPVIDLASRTLYFDSMVSLDNNVSLTNVTHRIYAISIDDGTTKAGWPVDVGPLFTAAGTAAANQNQRGALQLIGGVVYVPYGGHVGDCTPYRGIVIGIPVATPAKPTVWSTGSIGTGTAGRGGIWASGGLSSDGTSIYAATGNTSSDDGASGFSPPTEWSGGEAVFRFSAGPTFSNAPVDYYYPTNWATLDMQDADIGGANPVVFDMPAAPMPHLVAAFGKDGNLYLLNRDSLGKAGGGGELSITPVANGVITGAPAVYTTSKGTYVAFRAKGNGCPGGAAGNLVVAKITPGTTAKPAPTAALAWCSAEANLGQPMVTTTDGTTNFVVWNASTRLYGYDGDTGTKVFAGGAAGDVMAVAMQYFNTPIDAGQGRIAVATPGQLYVFRP